MKKKEVFQNQLRLKSLKNLMFFLLLPFFMQGQIDRVNIEGVDYCSRSVLDIIKKNKKVRYHVLPEEIVGDSVDYKIDSSYIYIKKYKYLQIICFSDKYKFKILTSVTKPQKKIYVQNLVNNKKGKIEFMEVCDIIFTGVKLLNSKLVALCFKAKFDGYVQYFSLKFDKDSMILNFDLPDYRKCD
jgi:hypothetical protein